MAEENLSRRKFLKGAAYAAPLVVGFTLVGTEVASAFTSNQTNKGKTRPRTRSRGPYENEYDGQGTHGESDWWFGGRN